MTLHQFLCGPAVMIILLSRGCQSQQPVCGRAVRNTRIVGGRNASSGSWPWLASLNDDDGLFCGGSLINNQWVLTAAHCLTGNELLNTTVYLGRLSQSGPNANEVSRGLERIIRHPSYDSQTYENDICLLKLSSPVDFTDYIQPVCLASAGSTFHSGVNSWVTGFGEAQAGPSPTADILQEVNVPIVGNNECKCTYPKITDSMMCAGLKEGGKDACQGDSGGPLVTKQDVMWIQSGIVSFGNGCAKPMTPGVYTRVSEYQEWITNTTDSSEPGFVTYRSSGVDSDLNITCSTTTIIPTPTATPTPFPTTMIPTPTANPTPFPTTMIPTPTATPTPFPTTMIPTPTATRTPFPTTMIPTPTATPNPFPTSKIPTPTATRTPFPTTMIPTPTATPIPFPTPTHTMILTFPATTSPNSTISKSPTTKTTPLTTKTSIYHTDKHVSIDSVFDSGENMIHFSHFTSLCLLVMSLFVLVG